MMTALAFFLSPLGRKLVGGFILLAVLGGIWLHGDRNGADRVQRKWDAAVARAVEAGETARRDAERDIGADDSDGLSNDPYNRDRS